MANLSIMGVVNITPNSFSDGGKFQDEENFKNLISNFRKFNVAVFDIGAESTAPMNTAISSDDEKERFKEFFLPRLELFGAKDTLSIDTYKSEIMEWAIEELLERNFKGKILWNDVSGVLDGEALRLLKKYPELEYVLSHTFVDRRKNSANHMQFVQDLSGEAISSHVTDFFINAKNYFNDVSDRVWFDPCFGFSKSFEQNWSLIKNFPAIAKAVDHPKWLVGVSRKSFFKRVIPDQNGNINYQIEMLHSQTLSYLLEKCVIPFMIVRVHDPLVVRIAQISYAYLR